MDREEALKMLCGGRKSVVEWNRLREAGESIPDLSNSDLSRVDLRGANLNHADLRRANLRGADLGGAELILTNLRNTDFSHANLGRSLLSGADLTSANLRTANLGWAKLVNASLVQATLIEANLSWADLRGADFREAKCCFTVFANADLSGVANLDALEHQGPSTVGIDTLFVSGGRFPETFLRGCGVPPSFMEYLPSLMSSMQPIQFYSCFISHSSKDQEFAMRLHSRMVQDKLRVWYSPENMRGGRKIVDQIDEAIRLHDKLLLVLSDASMVSDWVKYEIANAVKREKQENRQVLFPIALVTRPTIEAWSAFDPELGDDLSKVIQEYHIPDFSKWKDHDSFELSFARLIRDLKSEPANSGP
jgi:uncharacterized protein YjbI with pentapeptide repeats